MVHKRLCAPPRNALFAYRSRLSLIMISRKCVIMQHELF